MLFEMNLSWRLVILLVLLVWSVKSQLTNWRNSPTQQTFISLAVIRQSGKRNCKVEDTDFQVICCISISKLFLKQINSMQSFLV